MAYGIVLIKELFITRKCKVGINCQFRNIIRGTESLKFQVNPFLFNHINKQGESAFITVDIILMLHQFAYLF